MIVFQTTPRPIHSPWGAVQTANELAPGIWDVSTAGHGGLMLSPRAQRRRSGLHARPGGPVRGRPRLGLGRPRLPRRLHQERGPRCAQISAQLAARPYARFTVKVIQPGKSYTLDRDAFEALHAADWIASTAFGAWASFVERGQVGLCCQRRSDRSEAWFIVPEAEYAKRGKFGFVIDPARHIRIERPANPWADHPEPIRLAA